MKIKELNRTSHVAWSAPEVDTVLLAAGTSAQQVDLSFNTKAELEIFDPNTRDNEPLGKVETSERFHCLAWGSFGVSNGNSTKGIIAGGLDNGAICLWDPNRIINGDSALIFESKKHVGPVRSVQFNPFQAHGLASGGRNCDIFVWNVEKGEPRQLLPKPTQAEVNSIAWNKHCSYILGSCGGDGVTYIWDLRASKTIFRLNEASNERYRASCMEWNPESYMKLVTAFEDPRFSAVQLWDLRSCHTPVYTLMSHQKGVLSLAWCPKDSDLLMVSSIDCRTVVWNPNTSQSWSVVAELSNYKSPVYDTKWCSKDPNLLCTAAAQSLTIHNAFVSRSSDSRDSQSSVFDSAPADLSIAKEPRWLGRPCGGIFGFAGRLVRFSKGSNKVFISSIATDKGLVRRSVELKASLTQNTTSAYCEKRSSETTSPEEKSIWLLMRNNFEDSKRGGLMQLWGPQTAPQKDVHSSTTTATSSPRPQSYTEMDPSETFSFENLSLIENTHSDDEATTGKENREDAPGSFALDGMGSELDNDIAQSVLSGRLPDAVKLCLNNDRLSDALLVATFGSSQLLKSTQMEYLRKSNSKLNHLLRIFVDSDWKMVVSSIELSQWKEIFAFICTYPDETEFTSLFDILGDRFEHAQNAEYSFQALLCYVCSKNVCKFSAAWNKVRPLNGESLYDFVELALMLSESAGEPYIYDTFLCQKIREYCELVTAQGCVDTAQYFLEKLSSNDLHVAILRDRVYKLRPDGTQRDFPFEALEVPLPSAPRENGDAADSASWDPVERQGGGNGPTMPSLDTRETFPLQQPYHHQSRYPPSGPQHPLYAQYQPPIPHQPYQQPPPQHHTAFPPTDPPHPEGANFLGAYPQSVAPLVAPPVSEQPAYIQPRVAPPSFPPSNKPSLWEPPRPVTPASLIGGQQNALSYLPNQHLPLSSYGTSVRPPNLANEMAVRPLKKTTPTANANVYEHMGTGLAPTVGILTPNPPGSAQPVSQQRYYSAVNGVSQQQNFVDPSFQFSSLPSKAQNTVHSLPSNMPAAPEPPQESSLNKPPIPEKYTAIVSSLNDAITRCSKVQNSIVKKKLDEVRRKLEDLFDSLREDNVRPEVLQSLNEYCTALSERNYLLCHKAYTFMATTPNSSSISHWLTSLRALTQLLVSNRL
ncbi:protein transport protein Sec31A-like isoform X2 [Zophobas morio]|uniref:protein transport protein Sec31A-like isoform X2 n=1 Tax=Zophobas morio TaxID=2755281 RepID=UPI003082D313